MRKTLTFNGETKTYKEWEKVTGIRSETIRTRKEYGWSDEKTLTTPVRKRVDEKKEEKRRVIFIKGRDEVTPI